MMAVCAAPHRCGLGVEEVTGDAAVELVLVYGVNAALEPLVLTLEFGDSIVVELAFVTMTFASGLPHPDQRLVTECDPFQQAREPLFQHLLAPIRLRALSLEAGAVVVDVAAFFISPTMARPLSALSVHMLEFAAFDGLQCASRSTRS
jgi:hypothetical protein